LARKVGLDAVLVPPHHAHADGRDSDAVIGLAGFGKGVAKNVGNGRLIEDDYRQNFSDVVHARAGEAAPGMAVVLDAAEMNIAPPGVGKDVKVAKGAGALGDELALDRLLGRLVGGILGSSRGWGEAEQDKPERATEHRPQDERLHFEFRCQSAVRTALESFCDRVGVDSIIGNHSWGTFHSKSLEHRVRHWG
jgi:hypothetical protein